MQVLAVPVGDPPRHPEATAPLCAGLGRATRAAAAPFPWHGVGGACTQRWTSRGSLR